MASFLRGYWNDAGASALSDMENFMVLYYPNYDCSKYVSWYQGPILLACINFTAGIDK